MTRQEQTRLERSGQEEARSDETRQEDTRQEEARQEDTREEKTPQEETPQEENIYDKGPGAPKGRCYRTRFHKLSKGLSGTTKTVATTPEANLLLVHVMHGSTLVYTKFTARVSGAS